MSSGDEMIGPESFLSTNPHPQWYCIRSQPRREALAESSLRALGREIPGEFDVLYPRFRRRKMNRAGAGWVIESLFPNYLFARFTISLHMRAVRAARGVAGIVHFGEKYLPVPVSLIEELRELVGASQIHEIPDELQVGEQVTIAEGPFRGSIAEILSIKSGQERVRVFLDLVGRRTEMELSRKSVLSEREHPLGKRGKQPG